MPVWTGVENLCPPVGFDPRAVQPVASPYIDYANSAHTGYLYTEINSMKVLVKSLPSFVSKDGTAKKMELN